jgi:BirA family transcriptional regulator, biotin operon repressor / biotin---[acetyl-CoA-carboxylase] ligase
VVRPLTSAAPETVRRAVVESTMDLAHNLAAQGSPAGTAVVAEQQTGGRGSRGRAWHSPRGGLWLSMVLRPPGAAGVELHALRVGLTVAEAIEATAPGLSVAIKWPNDLMLGEGKVGGVLCEARWQGDRLAWVVAGIGINVSNPVPNDLQAVGTTLGDHAPGVTPGSLEPGILAGLRALNGTAERLSAAELTALRRRDWLRGKPLRGPVTGIAAGIADDGALQVASPTGAIVAIRAGTVELADPTLTA